MIVNEDGFEDYGMECFTCKQVLWWDPLDMCWGLIKEGLNGAKVLKAWSSTPETHDHYPVPRAQ